MASWNSTSTQSSRTWSVISSIIPSAFEEGDIAGTLIDFQDLLALEFPGIPMFESGEIDIDFHPHFIGQGASYRVYAAKCKRWTSVVAVKYARIIVQNAPANGSQGCGGPNDKEKFAAILQEVYTFCSFSSHPNVLSMLGWSSFLSEGGLTACLVTEYASHGSLDDFLPQQPTSDLDFLQGVCYDVASGLSALHQAGVVQGDIKIENILMCCCENGKVVAKIGDFGSAIFLDQTDQVHHYRGTVLCNAPEVAAQHVRPIPQSNLTACDVYSFGLLVWDVFNYGDRSYRQRLLDDQNFCITEATKEKLEGYRILDGAEAFSDGIAVKPLASLLKGIFNKTLTPDPKQRASAQDVCSILCPNSKQLSSSSISQSIGQPRKPSTEVSNGSISTKILGFYFRRYSWQAQMNLVRKLHSCASNPKHPECSEFALAVGACHAIGFGVALNSNAKIEWAKKASQLGCCFAKAIVQSLFVTRQDFSNQQTVGETSLLSSHDVFIDYVRSLKGKGDLHNFTAHGIDNNIINGWQLDLNKRHILKHEGEGSGASTTLRFNDNVTSAAVEPLLLHDVTFQNRLDIIQQLLDRGAEINHRENSFGQTALLSSLFHQDYEVTKLLLRAGANVSLSNNDGVKPVHYLGILPDKELSSLAYEIIHRGEPSDLVAAVLADQSDSNLPFGGTPLDYAVSLGNTKAVRILLQEGRDVYQNHPVALKDAMETASSYFYASICQLISCARVPRPAFPLHRLGSSNVYSIDVRHGWRRKEAISTTIKALQGLGYDINEIASDTETIDGRTPLSCAVYVAPGNFDIIDALLDHGADPRGKDRDGSSPLVRAVVAAGNNQNPGYVSLLLSRGSGVTEVVPYSGTLCQPLHIACDVNAHGAFEVLLQQSDIEINACNGNGQTPLHIACGRNLIPMIRMLLEAGVDADILDDQGVSPLEEAVRKGCSAAVTYLLDSGISVYNTQSTNGRSILFYATSMYVTKTQNDASLHLLRHERIQQQEILDWSDEEGWTAISKATITGQYAIVHELLELGARIQHLPEHSTMYSLRSPLWLLVTYHVPLEFTGHRKDFESVLGALVSKARILGELDARDSAGSTVLHWACYVANLPAVSVLLNGGAESKARNRLEETPLHKVTRGIIARFADETKENAEERSPLWPPSQDEAKLEDSVKRIISLLLSHGADVDAADIYGYTVLHDSILASAFSAEMAQLLLDRGACASRASSQGETPLQMVLLEDGCARPEYWEAINFHLAGVMHRGDAEKRRVLEEELKTRISTSVPVI